MGDCATHNIEIWAPKDHLNRELAFLCNDGSVMDSLARFLFDLIFITIIDLACKYKRTAVPIILTLIIVIGISVYLREKADSLEWKPPAAAHAYGIVR